MSNIELLAEYNRSYPEKHIPFLQEQNADWEKRKPLKGLKILHNLINSFETLHKLEPLLRAGADLTVTKLSLLETPYQKEVDQIIEKCEIRHIPNYKDLHGEFDLGLDCAARLLKIPTISFKLGVVELTQSGTEIYKHANLPYPVISVDDSFLKNLECMHGTGDGFLRACEELIPEKLNDQKFLVFGYGKIGQGIANYLFPITKNITIVEKSESALLKAKKRGLKVLPHTALAEIKQAAAEAFAIMTATGVTNLLSKFLQRDDLRQAYLANMGAEDEIGEALADYPKILFNRFPINFSLKHPTRMKYLDPIFYAHNRAAEMIASGVTNQPGYHPFDPQVDQEIIKRWVGFHQEAVDDIWD